MWGSYPRALFPQQYNRYPVQTSLGRKLKTQKDVTVAIFKRTWKKIISMTVIGKNYLNFDSHSIFLKTSWFIRFQNEIFRCEGELLKRSCVFRDWLIKTSIRTSKLGRDLSAIYPEANYLILGPQSCHSKPTLVVELKFYN